jgi:hypothetical protein
VYLVVGYFYILNLYGSPGLVIDFYGAFIPAVQRYLADPTKLYALTSLPFRSMPALVYYFMAYYFIPSAPYHLDLLACSIFIFAVNLACCYLIKKITALEQFNAIQFPNATRFVPILLCTYLLMPGQNVEYNLGQVNAITNMFLLLAVYYTLKKDARFSFFFLGCAGVFKITAILLLPFFLFENIRGAMIKKFLTRLCYYAIPFVPSIAMFVILKNCITGFLAVNMSLTEGYTNFFFTANTSIAKLVIALVDVNLVLVVIIIAIVMYTIAGYILIRYHVNPIERFMLGAFTMMLAMSDFYGVHLLFIFGITILWCLTKYRSSRRTYRYVFLAIITSYFGFTLNPFSVIIVLIIFGCFIIDMSRHGTMPVNDTTQEFKTSRQTMVENS